MNRKLGVVSAMALPTASPTELTKRIVALIDKGDKASDKAEQFYIAAGLHLKELKTKIEQGKWLTYLETKITISRQRASELMQIADGRKSLEGVCERKRKSMLIFFFAH